MGLTSNRAFSVPKPKPYILLSVFSRAVISMGLGMPLILFFFTTLPVNGDWLIRTYRSGTPVNGLSDADALIAGNFLIAATNIGLGDTLGFSTGEGIGHFTINNPVPGIPTDHATDNYAVQGTGFLSVPVSGPYTFGLNTDDGARLRID